MSAAEDLTQSGPILVEEPIPATPKKGRFSRKSKTQDRPGPTEASKLCSTCNHRLSKFYYWKASPCDNCVRSPENYYSFLRRDLPDNWEPKSGNIANGGNLLY